jgi:protein dithiol oxidoreductase (disulfide-forming)
MFLRSLASRPWCLLAMLAVTAGAAAGGEPAPAEAAQGYRVLAVPQPTASPGKIEALELFSYGCPHCNEFYPLLNAWLAKQPKDVVLRREAIGLGREGWVNLARAYYALKVTGDLPKLDGALFHALHEEHLPLFDEQHLAEWVGKHGGDAEKFTAAYISFAVNNQTVQADAMAQTYTIEGIPALIIDGRYLVLGDSHEQMLANADKAIALARSAAKARAPKAVKAK